MGLSSFSAVRVIDASAEGLNLPIVEGKGSARAVLWSENGARFRSMHLLDLCGGDKTVVLSHASDCVYYVTAGSGHIVGEGKGPRLPLIEGAMTHIDAGDRYRIEADESGLHLLGGPCPPDAADYATLRENG